jgi:uncharacterized protein YpuA (DUF1002 family)
MINLGVKRIMAIMRRRIFRMKTSVRTIDYILDSNKKRRVNSNTQNEIQKNISETAIELNKRAIISPRNLHIDHINIFDKITEMKDKPKGNYKNARNTINNIKNFEASENVVYTHNNYSDTPYRKFWIDFRKRKGIFSNRQNETKQENLD